MLEFAELGEFVDLKLKNYSSGMMVRLAFAVMVQADADIMLVDEVLAVGDIAFAQKCMDVFHERRRAGTTILLVTHDMGAVQSLCHRAMFIRDGVIDYIGDPEETAMRYYRHNFASGEAKKVSAALGGTVVEEEVEKATVTDINATVLHAHLENEAGERIENVEQGQTIVMDALIEAKQDPPRRYSASTCSTRRAPWCSGSPRRSRASRVGCWRPASASGSRAGSRTRWSRQVLARLLGPARLRGRGSRAAGPAAIRFRDLRDGAAPRRRLGRDGRRGGLGAGLRTSRLPT